MRIRLSGAVLFCSAFTFLATAQEWSRNPIEVSQRAQTAYQAGRWDEASEGYARLAGMLPRNASVRVAFARALVRQGKVTEALRELETAASFGMSFDAADEAWKSLSGDSRFQAIVSRMQSLSSPIIRSDTAFLLEKDLIPENIAWDPASNVFFVGSMYKAKILRIAPDGKVSDFVPARRDGLWGVLGMKVDPSRRLLWANSCNIDSPPMERPDPATAGKGAIFAFDLTTGALVRKIDGPRGDAAKPFCFNDLVIAPSGDIWATSGPDGIHRLRASADRTEEVVAPDGAWFNGIAISSDGKTVFAASHLHGVERIDTATGARALLQLPPGLTLGAIDGLYFHQDSLVGVQASQPQRVVRAWLDPSHTRVTRWAVLEQGHPSYDWPLTGAIVGDHLYYVARSQLRAFENGKIWPAEKLRDTVILKLPLELPGQQIDLQREREGLLAVHAGGLRAHIERNADWLADSTGESFVSASRGKISRRTPEDTRKFFSSYFAGATYPEYIDLEPPIVCVSDDGSMGWVLSRLKVRRLERDAEGKEKEVSFVYAGMMVYEKKNGAWVRVGNASTFEE